MVTLSPNTLHYLHDSPFTTQKALSIYQFWLHN